MKPSIVVGPAGCGKTRNAVSIAQKYGYTRVVDGWDYRTCKLVHDAVHLQTSDDAPGDEYKAGGFYSEIRKKLGHEQYSKEEDRAFVFMYSSIDLEEFSFDLEQEVVFIEPELKPEYQGFSYGDFFVTYGFEVEPMDAYSPDESCVLELVKRRIPMLVNSAHGEDPPLSFYLGELMQRGDLSILDCSAFLRFRITTQYDVAEQLVAHDPDYKLIALGDKDYGFPVPVKAIECRFTPGVDSFLEEEQRDESVSYFDALVNEIKENITNAYQELINRGVDMTVARRIIPRGLFNTTLTVSGSLLSWLRYTDKTIVPETQKEHRALAEAILCHVERQYPAITTAYKNHHCPPKADDVVD